MPCKPGSFPYVVQPGDTVWRLARRYHTSLEEISGSNPDADPGSLRVGQVLCIPGIPASPSGHCPLATEPYEIRPGDTLLNLARRRMTSLRTIMYYNPGLDPGSLQVGQVIFLPLIMGPPGCCAPGLMEYVIKPGDTIWELARQRLTSVGCILHHNPDLDPHHLQAGQVICLP